MRRPAVALGGMLGTLFVASSAGAQVDIAPPLPNVLLLVDTSGSMEFKTNGTNVTCNPGNVNATNEKSRWINVLEVLTGTFKDYSCQSLDRVSDLFKTGEYRLNPPQAPYDWRYPIPYHRPLTGGATGCVAGPGTFPGTTPNQNPYRYPVDPLRYHVYSNTSQPCTHEQERDGVIDAFEARVRFGLMTFDTEVDANRGHVVGDYTTINTVDLPGGQQGLFSYVVGQPAVGRPVGCADDPFPQEVGARNGSAPVWEGRMVNFGNPNDAEQVYLTKARQVQEVLLGTRPFGATPIAGMLKDAEDFFWNEASNDPDAYPAGAPDPFDDYGPRADPYLACDTERQQTIILLTDGEPNMDLRPDCVQLPDSPDCPFDRPDEIAHRLAHPIDPGRAPIKTFVVGFALEQIDADLNPMTTNTVSCNTITDPDSPSSPCMAPGIDNNIPLKACCNLQRIAIAGDGQAFFASNAGELRSALSEILRRNVTATSRTQPATAGGSANSGGGYRFFSGFEVGQLALWNGRLTRQRWECVAPNPSSPKVPTPRPILESAGDDFIENVNFAGPTGANSRPIYTVVGRTTGGAVVNGAETVRRGIGGIDPDGAGTVTPDSYEGLAPAFADSVPTEALAIPNTARPIGVDSDDEERSFFLEWLLGVNPTNAPYHRCSTPSRCELIGDIYHSTPQVAGAPDERLQDESYLRFASEQKLRPIVLYTSTNDGFVHAFKVASNDPADLGNNVKLVLTKTNNELWAFAPPAVLPSLYSLYPFNHQTLLDGVAVVSDVVAVENSPATDPPTVFERNQGDAAGGGGTWRTVLVQGFGGGRGGYFALDVTNPEPDSSDPLNTDKGGPRFLWQLTRDSAGNELFGRAGGTPTITTLHFDPTPAGTNPREIPVAILPGGRGGTPTGVACPEAPEAARTYPNIFDSRFTPRGKVNCYNFGSGNAEIGARSLTIVRLDTGEIIRHFRQDEDELASSTLRSRTTEVNLDSPISGQPVAFPGRVGAVADRVLVGDQDGRLWKVNVASTNPANWTMTLFFDLYPESIGSASTHDFNDGQPISTPPVLSVDELGNMTVNAATGDQDSLGFSTSQVNYVYSFTELFDLDRTAAPIHRVNWLQSFQNGERVVGPLVLFNANLYFASFLGSSGNNVCDAGTSRLWGMQYIQPQNPPSFTQGGLPALVDGTTKVQKIDDDDAVIFGVSLAKQPTCYSRIDDDVGNDLIGYQGQTTISQVTPAKFELVMHTSSGSGSGPGTGQGPNQRSIELEKPASFARVVSWASIIE